MTQVLLLGRELVQMAGGMTAPTRGHGGRRCRIVVVGTDIAVRVEGRAFGEAEPADPGQSGLAQEAEERREDSAQDAPEEAEDECADEEREEQAGAGGRPRGGSVLLHQHDGWPADRHGRREADGRTMLDREKAGQCRTGSDSAQDRAGQDRAGQDRRRQNKAGQDRTAEQDGAQWSAQWMAGI